MGVSFCCIQATHSPYVKNKQCSRPPPICFLTQSPLLSSIFIYSSLFPVVCLARLNYSNAVCMYVCVVRWGLWPRKHRALFTPRVRSGADKEGRERKLRSQPLKHIPHHNTRHKLFTLSTTCKSSQSTHWLVISPLRKNASKTKQLKIYIELSI